MLSVIKLYFLLGRGDIMYNNTEIDSDTEKAPKTKTIYKTKKPRMYW